MTPLLRFLKSEDGPTAVEYAVMLALILLVVMSSVKLLQQRTGDTFNRCSDELDGVGF
jgi:pilus assembly protein Flp/PilA